MSVNQTISWMNEVLDHLYTIASQLADYDRTLAAEKASAAARELEAAIDEAEGN